MWSNTQTAITSTSHRDFLLPAAWSTITAARVGMCCSEWAQWATSDASSSNRWGDNHSWAHLSRWHHCLIPPQWFIFFQNPKSGFDSLSHQDEIDFVVVVVASAFCEHMNCPECRNLKCQCVIWVFSCVRYELHGLWVCVCDPAAQQTIICLLVMGGGKTGPVDPPWP